MPAGALWALAFFVAAELGFRMLPGSCYLAFDQHDYERRDVLDYDAVSAAMAFMPPADVLVMGTSRAREGLHSPELAAALEAEVRNYGVASGRIPVSLALLHALVRDGRAPRVVVLAVDASDFRDLEPAPERYLFGRFDTLSAIVGEGPWPSERELGPVIANSLPLRMLDARPTARYRLPWRGALDADAARSHNAAFGGATTWHRDYEASLEHDSALPQMRSNRDRVRRIATAYAFLTARAADLVAFLDLAARHGVRVVLVELPVAPRVRTRRRVKKMRGKLQAALDSHADRPCVSAWRLGEREGDFGATEFREDSHLNARGARQLSALIAPTIADALARGPCGR